MTDLALVDNRQDENRFSVALDGGHATLHQVLPVLQKPMEICREFGKRFDPIFFQPLNRVKRNQADQRTHPKLLEVAIRIAQDVIKEKIFLVPQLVVAAIAHALHGCAHIDIVLEKFAGQPFVYSVLLRQLECDAHQVETERAHPSRGV